MEKHKPRVLVVEDDRFTLMAMTKLLQANGVVVRAALTTKAAIRYLHSCSRPALSCVFLDLQLFDGPGIVVLQYIRANRMNIPVVVTTGSKPAEPVYQAALALRPEGFVHKPVSAGWLRNFIAGLPENVDLEASAVPAGSDSRCGFLVE